MTTPACKARGKIRIMPKLSNDPASLVIVTSPLFHMLFVMNISIPFSHLLYSCTSQSTTQHPPEPLLIILMMFCDECPSLLSDDLSVHSCCVRARAIMHGLSHFLQYCPMWKV